MHFINVGQHGSTLVQHTRVIRTTGLPTTIHGPNPENMYIKEREREGGGGAYVFRQEVVSLWGGRVGQRLAVSLALPHALRATPTTFLLLACGEREREGGREDGRG